MATPPVKIPTHAENMKAFKENLILLSQNVAFAKMHNLDEKKLKSECLFVIEILESFTGANGEKNQKNFIGSTPESLQICLIKVVLNKHLTLNKKLGMCFLIPRGGVFTLMPGYPVYIAAAREHGVSISVQTVRENDICSNEIVDGQSKFTFKQEMFGKSKIVGYVAYSKDLQGFTNVVSFGLEDVDKRRKKAEGDSIWAAWTEEQSQKTVILRLCVLYYRQYLKDLLAVDSDMDYALPENDNKNALEGEKTDFTAEEKKAFQSRINAAATSRELALQELGNIIEEYAANGFNCEAFTKHYSTLIDKKFPPQAQIEAAHELEIVPPTTAETVPYKPTPEIFEAFKACKTADALNDMIDSVLTDLTLSKQDTAPFLEYADKLRAAFKMKS